VFCMALVAFWRDLRQDGLTPIKLNLRMPPTTRTTVLDPKTGSFGAIVGSIARKDHEAADLELFTPYRAPSGRKCNRIAETSGRTRPAGANCNEPSNVYFVHPCPV